MLTMNNPVMEANKARIENDIDSMQAVFTNAVAKVMAENQGTVNITAGAINTVKSGVKETTGEIIYTVTDPTNEENSSGKIVFDKKDKEGTTYYTGKKLPIYSAGNTTWYVDEEGNISLNIGDKIYGTGKIILDNVVIDYAKPVTINYEKIGESKIIGEKCYASYGDVAITGDNTLGAWSVTYTLNKFLNDIDEVYLVCENGEEYIINIVPANNIYYEDDFSGEGIVYTDGSSAWQKNDGTGNIEHINGNVHGWIESLSDDEKYSDDSVHYIVTNSTDKTLANVSISFVGTGIDVYGRTSLNTGKVAVQLYKAGEKKALKTLSIDTLEKLNGDEGFYQIPAVFLNDLEYGAYTLKITIGKPTADGRGTYYLDGIRIYNPLGSNDKLYDISERGAIFTTLKSILFDYNKITNNQEKINGAIVLDKVLEEEPIIAESDKCENEIFLNSNQAIVFKVGNTTGAHYYVGLKNPSSDGTTVKITDGESTKNIEINAASDLYYEVIPNSEGYVSITNISANLGTGNVLSITKLRTTGLEGKNDIVGISAEEALNIIRNN